MEEFIESDIRVAPLSPPRWKGAQSLSPIQGLNEHCVGLLCGAAASNSVQATLPALAENLELWVRLEPEARRRIAQVPFVLVDAQFRCDDLWQERAAKFMDTAAGADRGDSQADASNGLPRETSEAIMLEAAMFAWQMAGADKMVARIGFAMSASVAETITTLTPRAIREIACHEWPAVELRWGEDVPFWREMLLAAQADDDEMLSKLQLQAKILLCSELVRVKG